MKAVRMTHVGDVDALEYYDEAEPKAGENQVVVEVAAAGVNFMDIGARRGMASRGYKPSILGVEGAGRVIEVGPGVTEFNVGDRVAWVFVPSSYAERIVAPVSSLVKVPDEIDDKTAAAAMMQGLTASHFATDFYPVQPGDVALVHAGAGGLGLLLTQIIKLRGGSVISRVSSESKVAIAKEAGADHVIVDSEGNFAVEAVRLSGGEGVHVVYDGSGPTTFQGSLDALRRSGTFCWYGPVLGGPGALDIMSLPKSIKLGYAVFLDHVHTPELLRARSENLFQWIQNGELKVNIGNTYHLSDARQAHVAMESRATTGKLLLMP
ncbi:quinone oxidoreductase [Rhizobium sp. S163]|uniref:quinone oxidoreductase family protein n=1 Tax=Rhizobium sp. S163 TaxID=3055039 RepID=UPI0025A9F14A|nr:quinone oxidoreductase [Rhizobium sp. S163]MDM9648710.1 quinone oxidoreductase [Rhizobium sp. S163]